MIRSNLAGGRGRERRELDNAIPGDDKIYKMHPRKRKKGHDDNIANKSDNSLNHDNLVHKPSLIPQAMKIPGATSAVDKEWDTE